MKHLRHLDVHAVPRALDDEHTRVVLGEVHLLQQSPQIIRVDQVVRLAGEDIHGEGRRGAKPRHVAADGFGERRAVLALKQGFEANALAERDVPRNGLPREQLERVVEEVPAVKLRVLRILHREDDVRQQPQGPHEHGGGDGKHHAVPKVEPRNRPRRRHKNQAPDRLRVRVRVLRREVAAHGVSHHHHLPKLQLAPPCLKRRHVLVQRLLNAMPMEPGAIRQAPAGQVERVHTVPHGGEVLEVVQEVRRGHRMPMDQQHRRLRGVAHPNRPNPMHHLVALQPRELGLEARFRPGFHHPPLHGRHLRHGGPRRDKARNLDGHRERRDGVLDPGEQSRLGGQQRGLGGRADEEHGEGAVGMVEEDEVGGEVGGRGEERGGQPEGGERRAQHGEEDVEDHGDGGVAVRGPIGEGLWRGMVSVGSRPVCEGKKEGRLEV
mmetsp:Transcript_9105/g.23888  ORF Transcript_9105/g.23888 Transcript_9105/m.23888 type:complete len:436 (+) Transcript_9105:328-1635(+)